MHNYAQAGVDGFFCSNGVKTVSYSILHNYDQTDVIALKHLLATNFSSLTLQYSLFILIKD